jgi:hypothetical protein
MSVTRHYAIDRTSVLVGGHEVEIKLTSEGAVVYVDGRRTAELTRKEAS